MTKMTPVILSGGSGTRLWPLSRSMYPKQFLSLVPGDEASLLSLTARRLAPGPSFANPLVMCNDDHRFLVEDGLRASGIEPLAIVLEPVARNTAPAITVAALMLAGQDPEAIMVVMPSDHVIRDAPGFVAAVEQAGRIAASGRLVLFGIQPSHPETGYGYIRRGEPHADDRGAHDVAGFAEKPDAETAKRYLASGAYFWNSGIFVLHAATFLAEVERLQPAVLAAARASLAGAKPDMSFLRLETTAYAKAPSISVDYAVMEHTRRAAMIGLDIGWSDIGTWSALWDVSPRDEAGNAVAAEACLQDTHDCFIHSDRALVATLGVDNLVIVNTPDALLVADRGRAQDVSKLVQSLKASGRREHEQHLRNSRPWGYFETLAIAPRFQVKKLHVKPGGKLSLQMHHHRSEHWVVVQGTARVVVGDTEKLVLENESIYITATQWHRLENPGKVPLELIEVQIGSYLGEDDIIRSDDVYNRRADETK